MYSPIRNLTSVYEVMSRRTQHYEQGIQDFEVRNIICYCTPDDSLVVCRVGSLSTSATHEPSPHSCMKQSPCWRYAPRYPASYT